MTRQELSEKKQLAAHPVLKKLLNNADDNRQYPRTNPIPCGMLKYKTYLTYQSVGPKLEHQSLTIAMSAYVYISARLEHDLEEGDTM
jgi:hypothetical protein